MSSSTKIAALVLIGLAAVQASAIGRKGVESKDTADLTKNGIAIKTGVEGYVRRDSSKTAVAESRKGDALLPASTLDVYKALLMYHASFLPAIGLKIAKVILHFAIALFVGIGTTTAVCTFTPLCNISYNVSKPSFLSDQSEMLPALKEAYEVVSRIPNFFKKQETPEPEQPEPTTEQPNVLEEIPADQELDARNPQKNINAESRSDKSLKLDAKENEA